MIVLGVDPGSKDTGLVVVDTGRREVLDAYTVTANTSGLPVAGPYVAAVVDALADLAAAHPLELVAVEGLRRPSWHVRGRNGGGQAAANPEHVIATAVLLGAVMATAGTLPVVVVAPAGNGSAPLGAYPLELSTPAERRDRDGRRWQLRTGTGQLRHQRSAFDVALAGPRLHRAVLPAT